MTKEERNAYMRAYYAVHRDVICARSRAYARSHSAERAAYMKAYRATHLEYCREKNRDKLNARQRERYVPHPRQKKAAETLEEKRARFLRNNPQLINTVEAIARLRRERGAH